MVSGRCNYQLDRRLVLAGETLSHPGAVQRNEVENAERPDAMAGELQQRVDDWSQSAGFVSGEHVPLSIHAPSAACSLERDQGAEGRRAGLFETVIFTMGHELAIPLRIREKLGSKLRESAGNYWPIEET